MCLARTRLQAAVGLSLREGGNITFACPGTFTVKGGAHGFVGPVSQPAQMQNLPSGAASAIRVGSNSAQDIQIAQTLAELIEMARSGTGVLSSAMNAKTYGSLSAQLLDNTIAVAKRDIQTYRQIGMHVPYFQGSLVNWSKADIDWSKYDDGGSAADVLQNFVYQNLEQ